MKKCVHQITITTNLPNHSLSLLHALSAISKTISPGYFANKSVVFMFKYGLPFTPQKKSVKLKLVDCINLIKTLALSVVLVLYVN